MNGPKPPRQATPSLALAVVLLTVLFAATFRLGWVGYIGSDDWAYILNARQRMTDPFVIGTNHWQVRMALTLPMALSFKLFGESELSAALPTLAYAYGTGLSALLFLWRRVGWAAALLAGLFLATSPLLVVSATSLRVDCVETFFVVASLLVFVRACERTRGETALLLLTGLLAGLAFTTRPTAVALLAFYGVLFLAGHRIVRARYALVLAGFLAVWLAESLYYLLATGQFLYRLHIDFHHDQVVRPGGLMDAVVIAPLRMLLTAHGFGLAFWLLPPLAWYAGRASASAPPVPALVRYFVVFALVWVVVFSVFASKLVLDPRYLAPALTATVIVIAMSLEGLWRNGRRALAAALTAAILVAQVLGICVDNKDYMYAERWFVRLLAERLEPIHTDPETYGRAVFLLQLAGVEARARSAPPPPGSLFLAVPENAARGRYNTSRWDPATYEPGDWPAVERLDPGRTAIGRVTEAVGLSGWLPAHVWQKLDQPNAPVTLYRRPLE
jgi:4-amino-4-deoxy-L-arabinose transferase-like glycosyltransferase